jgi:2,4-dienoyl-CoA reductase-like NADH-dependent reductase (Old Yellow Enzyme family)
MRACRKVTSKLLPLPFATAIRTEASFPTAALGLITEPEHAEHIIATGEADAIFLARAMLRNPRWTLMASEKLGHSIDWPMSLERGSTV